MLSTQFEDIFSKTHLQSNFKGVFPSDLIPKKIPINNFIICNTDSSSSSGAHWYVVYRIDKSTLEVFDSLGIDTEKRHFLSSKFKLRGIKSLQFNTTPVQSDSSVACGQFCVYFIFQRLHNQDLEFTELLNEIFDADCERNEHKVSAFFNEQENG